MRALALFSALASGLLVSFTANAAELSYSVLLQTPRIQSLQTSLNTTGGPVQVQLQVAYDIAGKSYFTGAVDGISVSGKPTLKTVSTGLGKKARLVHTYKFSLRAPTVPATVLSISGALGGPAVCNYTGPRGRTNIAANPVFIDALQPVPAKIETSPLVSIKNVITGAARFEAYYTTNSVLAGTVKGKVSTNGISLSFKQDKRSATFTGRRMSNAYVGTLRLTIPPARQTISNFTLPLTDISVAAGNAIFRGLLSTIFDQVPVPAAGSRITVRSDINSDGKFLGREVVNATANKEGRYEIKFNVVRGRPVMLEIRRPGFAEILQYYSAVTPGAMLTRNAVLQPLYDLEVAGASAASEDGSIQLDGLPVNIASVQARMFSPVNESAQFPGEFMDNQKNLLVSSVFATVEAAEEDGRSVTNLGNNATLSMKVPMESWATLGDLATGNDRINVPLYYYDEADGQWKRNASDGWLENSSHVRIPESQLGAIRSGSYVGDVFAVGPISHLSWWNIDWPISSHTCIKGLILDTDGLPVSGASVSAVGLTYNGTTGPESTGPSGLFCLEVMRSEGAGEDVDGDGTLGEMQTLLLKVRSGTNQFAFGPFSSVTTAATCNNGAGLDVGSLVLNGARLLHASDCTITGQVVYSGLSFGGMPANPPGGGVRNARVAGYDPEALDAMSGTCSNCFVTTADAQGYFSLRIPVMEGATLGAFGNVRTFSTNFTAAYGVFIGGLTTAGCPEGDLVTIEADYFHVGDFLMTLYQRGEFWGTGRVLPQDGSIQVVSALMNNGLFYVGSHPSAGLPLQTGLWATVPMRNSVPGTGIGSIYFTVTSVFPSAGTWELKGGSVRASGTWRSAISFP